MFSITPRTARLTFAAIAADSEYLIAMSRTYNLPSAKAAGTFGQALPAVPFDELITTGESRRITFMSENADTRANLGCVNGTDAPVTIDISQNELAELCNVSRSLLASLLAALRKDGLIEPGYGTITVLQPARIEERLSQFT